MNRSGEKKKTAAERPMAYSRVDLDRDGSKELIVRSFTSEATEGGQYIYHVYRYDGNSKEYTELPDALFYSWASEGLVHFQKETGYLFIDETMGETCFGVYSLSDDALHSEYETSDDMGYLPRIKFQKIRVENDQTVETKVQESSSTAPFYGIWCYGSRESGDAYSYAENLNNAGFSANVFLTTDWSNLNTERYYVVTAGVYGTEDEAKANLASVQSACSDAYVKYSGDYQGQ